MKLKENDLILNINEIGDNKRELIISSLNNSDFLPREKKVITRYNVEFIKELFNQKKEYVCDEIHREKIQIPFRINLIKNAFGLKNKSSKEFNILDFGSGISSSTIAICSEFPNSIVTCIELNKDYVELAKKRIAYHNLLNVEFIVPNNPDMLPQQAMEKKYDICFLSAVVEHLLPLERKNLLPQIWSRLKPNGKLLVCETPYRWFPVEVHSTSLPFINYFPDFLAWRTARYCTKKYRNRKSLNEMLRAGLRGTTKNEIKQYVGDNGVFIKPNDSSIKDEIDLWYFSDYHKSKQKYMTYIICKLIKFIFNIEITPWLTICINKKL